MWKNKETKTIKLRFRFVKLFSILLTNSPSQISVGSTHSRIISFSTWDHVETIWELSVVLLNSSHILFKLNLVAWTAISWHSHCMYEEPYKVKFDICLMKLFPFWEDPENTFYTCLMILKDTLLGANLRSCVLVTNPYCELHVECFWSFYKILAHTPFSLPTIFVPIS